LYILGRNSIRIQRQLPSSDRKGRVEEDAVGLEVRGGVQSGGVGLNQKRRTGALLSDLVGDGLKAVVEQLKLGWINHFRE
jgi:hypothetical protein